MDPILNGYGAMVVFLIFINEVLQTAVSLAHPCLSCNPTLSPQFRRVSLQLWQVSSVIVVGGGERGGRSNILYSAVLSWCMSLFRFHSHFLLHSTPSVVYVYGFCDPNAVHSVAISNIFRTREYQPKNSTQVYQTLQDTDKLLNTNRRLHHQILFTDKEQLNYDIIHTILLCGKIRILTPLWSNSELQFIVTVWCAVWDVQLTSHFIFNGCLKGEMHLQFLHEEFHLLEVMCLNRQGCMYIQYNRDPFFLWSSEPQEQSFPWVMDEAWQAQFASQMSTLKTTRLLWMEMDEWNDLQHEVWNMRHTALSHFGHDTPCQEKSVLR